MCPNSVALDDFKFTFYNPYNGFENQTGLLKVAKISEFLLS